MQQPDIELADVLITAQLARRSAPHRNAAAEVDGLTCIAASMHEGRDAIFGAICAIALSCCPGGSAGISVLLDPPEEGFRWDALVGRFGPYLHGRAPRHDSPCGVSLDLGAPQLFRHPERYFTWLRGSGIPIIEGLVVPLYLAHREPYGALWVMSHDEGHQFSATDAQLMVLLADHVSAALQLNAQRGER